MRVQTVTIEGQDGAPLVINSDDFDTSKHKIYGADDIVDGALRKDGPTVAEYAAAGYDPKNYPPAGYESRSTPEEINEAITKASQASSLQPAAPVAHDANGNPVNAGDGGQMVPTAQTTPPPAQQPGNAELLLVQKKGKKFVVVNLSGEEVEREGIVKGGYASEDEARAAITAATTPAA